ncbi:M1 family metallopeptidase [bacterium]|nr:M1 family metallopeptidase [bacterium]
MMIAKERTFNITKRISILSMILILLPDFVNADYWQQKVIYNIDVTLIDSVHQLNGHESISYINNSPDDLDMIWMHLWPNAYKNNQSALARQKFNQFSTKMHFLPDSSFGWIEITDVQADGHNINWEYRSQDTLDVARFLLNEPLLSGDTLILDLNFIVRVPNVLSRLGHFGQHYELTQWYPKPAVYDKYGWHPISYLDMGEFYSEWGDFEVSISVPQNYRVAATGVLQDSTEIIWRDSLAQIGNTYLDSFKLKPKPDLEGLEALIEEKQSSSDSLKTITFKQNNVHDFAWFADKSFIILHDEIELSSGKRVQAWTYALPKNLKNYRLSNAYISDAVSFYSDQYMEYPYKHATVVDGDFSAGGGMEYPMITLINNTGLPPLLEQVIIHEVGHNWFYGLSGNNEREYPWMDEGLNSYAENKYWAAKYSDDSMFALHEEEPFWYPILKHYIKDFSKSAVEDLAYYLSAVPKMDQAPNLHSEAYPEFNYAMMVYKKTALSTETLHAYLGDTLMDSVWHAYFSRWAFKHPQPEDIRQVFEEVSGENLSWYFDDMLGSTAKIDYALTEFSSSPRGNVYETTVQVMNQGDFNPPLQIAVIGKTETDKKTTWVRPKEKDNVFTIISDFPVNNVILDPDFVLMDMNRANNDKKMHLDFDLVRFELNPEADYVVNLLPYLWYGSTDKIMPGIFVTHLNLIPWDSNWYLRGYYGPITKTVGLSGSISKKLIPRSGREILLSTRGASNWYLQQLQVSSTVKNRNLLRTDDESSWKISLLAQDLSDPEIVVDGDTIRSLDPFVWDADQFLKLTIGLESNTRRTLWTSEYELKGALGTQKHGKAFVKIQSYFKYRKKYSRKGSIRTTLFGGLAFGDLPNQERYYLSTDIDSEFSRKTIFSRNGNWFTPGHSMLYPNAYTIPGYLYSQDSDITPSARSLFGAKVRVDIPKLESFHVLTGIGMALDQDDDKWEAIASITPGWQFGPLQLLYTPFRLESGQFETDWKRFQIAFDMSTGGRIRIGI